MCLILGFYILIIGIIKNEAIEGRAIMIEPPQRSSLWRFRYDTKINIADNLQNCGGYEVQWEKNGGRCGVCGDPYNGPLTHDDGGIYASGIVARTFEQGGYVNVTVEILSNLLGYFEFRLCPRNSTERALTQVCFDTNLLWIEESWSTRYYVGSRGGIYDLHVRLPDDIICSSCVFQWKFSTGYRTGGINSCESMGSGRQEQFINCADIKIRPRPPNVTFYDRTQPNVHEPLFMLPPTNLSKSDVTKLRELISAYLDPTEPMRMDLPIQFNFMPPHPYPHDHTHTKPTPTGRDPPFRESLGISDLSALDRILYNMNSGQGETLPVPKIRGINFEPTLPTPVKSTTVAISSPVPKVETTTTIATTARPKEIVPPRVVPPKAQPPPPISVAPSVEKPFITSPTPSTELGVQRLGIPIQMPGQYNVVNDTPGIAGSSMTIPMFSAFDQAGSKVVDTSVSTTSVENCTPFSKNFRCRGKGQYLKTKGIDRWCIRNCRTGNCATFMCDCDCGAQKREKQCHAIGTFESIPGMDEWCTNVCVGNTCPANVCNVEKCLSHDVR